MVKISAFTSLLLLALPAIASPTPAVEGTELVARHDSCIAAHEAHDLLKKYISLFNKPIDEKVANKILYKDITVTSSSNNFMTGQQNRDPGTTSRAQFIQQRKALQATQPVIPQYTVLDKIFDCKKLWFRWQDDSKPFEIRGFDALYLTKVDGCWQIKQDFNEYNTGIILFDFGLFPCPAPSNTTPNPTRKL